MHAYLALSDPNRPDYELVLTELEGSTNKGCSRTAPETQVITKPGVSPEVEFDLSATDVELLLSEGRTTLTFTIKSSRDDVLVRTDFEQFLVIDESWQVPFQIVSD
jgi:hypothetical protein